MEEEPEDRQRHWTDICIRLNGNWWDSWWSRSSGSTRSVCATLPSLKQHCFCMAKTLNQTQRTWQTADRTSDHLTAMCKVEVVWLWWKVFTVICWWRHSDCFSSGYEKQTTTQNRSRSRQTNVRVSICAAEYVTERKTHRRWTFLTRLSAVPPFLTPDVPQLMAPKDISDAAALVDGSRSPSAAQ